MPIVTPVLVLLSFTSLLGTPEDKGTSYVSVYSYPMHHCACVCVFLCLLGIGVPRPVMSGLGSMR